VSKYVLLYRGFVLPELEDDEPCRKPRSKWTRATGNVGDTAKIGQIPLANMREATNIRVQWAAALGGAIGNVVPGDIQVVRLLPLPRATRANQDGTSATRQGFRNARGRRMAVVPILPRSLRRASGLQ
jgi:hypothetical protein